MPLQLSNAAIEQFKLTFTLRYQAVAKITGQHLNDIYSVLGDAYQLPFMGEVEMHDRGAYQSLIEATDQSITKKVINFSNKTVMIAQDFYQQHEVASNPLGSIAQSIAKSMGRTTDQYAFDAMDATTSSPVAVGTTNLTIDKIKEAKAAMDEANVDSDNRFLVCGPSQISALLGTDGVSNMLYANQRTLVDGNINTFLGFHFITVGSYGAGLGLPLDGNNRTCFAWSKSALTRAFQIAPSVDTQWSASHQSHLCVGRVRAGAIVGQDEGVIKIICDETA